jgi:hypothetical protein
MTATFSSIPLSLQAILLLVASPGSTSISR